MRFIVDLHLHSKYSRATSSKMNLEEMAKWAEKKGLKVLGTGDFTHPLWFKEIKEKLEPAEKGLFKLKNSPLETRFLLSTEISLIYSQGGKMRRIHHLILAPDLLTAEKINIALSWQGNLEADGRPILGLSSIELAKLLFNISEEIALIPAHIWTPWFSLFGSFSGFDSIEECFGDWTEKIFALETGLSSDPGMNWRWSALDRFSLVSNSDSHSLEKLGREANVFETELSYQGIIYAIKEKNPQKFLYTIEFFPEEGKYHYDGHRLCGIVFSPEETQTHQGICPRCHKPLTIGVMNRIEQLADREKNYQPSWRVPYRKIVPLEEILAEIFGLQVNTKKVKMEYERLVKIFHGELPLLLEADLEAIRKEGGEKLKEAITRIRKGEVKIRPGFDGEYGKIKIFEEGEFNQWKENTLF